MLKFLSIFRYYFTLHGLSVARFSVTLSRFLSAVRLIVMFKIAGLNFRCLYRWRCKIVGCIAVSLWAVLLCCWAQRHSGASQKNCVLSRVYCYNMRHRRPSCNKSYARYFYELVNILFLFHSVFNFQFSFFVWRRVITNYFGLNVVGFNVRITTKYPKSLHNCSAATGWTANFQEIEIPKYLIAIILDRTGSPHYFYA